MRSQDGLHAVCAAPAQQGAQLRVPRYRIQAIGIEYQSAGLGEQGGQLGGDVLAAAAAADDDHVPPVLLMGHAVLRPEHQFGAL